MSMPRDAAFVGKIVAQLKRGGALNDPRAHDRTVPLADYVKREVQRSIDRVRLRKTYKPDAPTATEDEIKHAVAVLRRFAATAELRAALDWFDDIRQEPPAGTRATLKWHCAAEAFDLMTFFSTMPPTGFDGGPFQNIAGLIFEAVTGQSADDPAGSMKRACDAVRRERLEFNPNAFARR